ncbi:hypothetical protein BGZ99_002583, partial [Dissophora globulifera]
IASGSSDKTVRLWDAQTGVPGLILIGHTGYVKSVTYFPGGYLIASGDSSETVRLWDADSGQCLMVVDDARGVLSKNAWSATLNGIFFAAGSGNSVYVWKVIQEEDHYKTQLHWRSTHSELSLSKSSIQNVKGLSRVNIQLLKQRGAVGDPTPPLSLRDASWKLASMGSVASRLKVPASNNSLHAS